MKKNIFLLFFIALLGFTSCNDDMLDRPQLNKANDETFWINENNLRLYVNGFYTSYFVGYNTGYTLDYAPLRGYYFSDDFSTENVQPNFETIVPNDRGGSAWILSYQGPNWYFTWVRKANLVVDRIQDRMSNVLTPEAYNHWLGVARFFRALEYSRQVGTFGDVPYFNKSIALSDEATMYKDRDPRGVVMDGVYDDFKFALENVRLNDGAQFVNKYVVAGFITRWMLFEGTWQKYHLNDKARSKKYLEFARDAAEFIMNSGKYSMTSDFRSLFGSEDLASNKECIFYRHYDAGQKVTHSIASYSNTLESQTPAPNLLLAKSFICNDGKVWQNSTVANADSFNLANLQLTRDPRFEASFWQIPDVSSVSLLYCVKFISREGATTCATTGIAPAMYGSNTNTNDYPILRLGEVLLNWIEAKAELAELGGSTVTQADIDKSINAIRNRPLDATAISKGVKKTAAMQLSSLPNDPSRDSDVPALIWEIRRERRMEFVYEHSRLLDIKRWKKLNYMDFDKYPDGYKGLWINFEQELPSALVAGNKDKLKVQKADGQVITYKGDNGKDMVGWYMIRNASNRLAFTDKSYVSPMGKAQIDQYAAKGYKLTQSPGW